MVTKSGTQEFHATAFWNRRHESMNANTFFNRCFVGGYGVGGPIYIPGKFNSDKRRLFYFLSRTLQITARGACSWPDRGGNE